MAMAAACQKEYKAAGGPIDRGLFLFDAFEEIPKSSYGSRSEFLFNSQQADQLKPREEAGVSRIWRGKLA